MQIGGSVQSIQLSPADPSAATGHALQLTAMATYSDGGHQDVTLQANWTSSNTAVAAAGPGGQVAAMSAGFSVIRASLMGASAATQLTVTASGAGLPPGYAYIASVDSQHLVGSGAILQFAIGSDGSLSPLAVASVSAGSWPVSVSADPSGRFVYVANLLDATISQFAIGADGGLVPLAPAVVAIPGPYPMAVGDALSVGSQGRFLYVVTSPRDPPGPVASIAQYAIGTDGTLSSLTPGYLSLATAASGALTLDPGGQHAYLAGRSPTAPGVIAQFAVGGDGTLALLTPAQVAVASAAVAVAIAPDGRNVYALSDCADPACDGQVAQYAVGMDGALAPTGATTTMGGHVVPLAMLLTGGGSNAYLLANLMGVDTNAGVLYQFTINGAGALVAATPASLAVSSGAVAAATYGVSVHVLSSNAVGFASGMPTGGHIDHYVIGSGGLLTAAGSTPVATGDPSAIALVVAH